MSNQIEVILSGVGGQGTILCGTLLGEAAALHDNKKATLTSEYGVETRGTFAKSDVIVSDEEIFFPDATQPKVVLCLAQVAYQRYAGNLPEDTLLIYDADQVTPSDVQAKQEGISIGTMARELGNMATANIIAMGIVVARTGMVTPEAAKKAVGRFFGSKSQKIVDLNYKAFDLGYSL